MRSDPVGPQGTGGAIEGLMRNGKSADSATADPKEHRNLVILVHQQRAYSGEASYDS
jgi:hypothetical protein